MAVLSRNKRPADRIFIFGKVIFECQGKNPGSCEVYKEPNSDTFLHNNFFGNFHKLQGKQSFLLVSNTMSPIWKLCSIECTKQKNKASRQTKLTKFLRFHDHHNSYYFRTLRITTRREQSMMKKVCFGFDCSCLRCLRVSWIKAVRVHVIIMYFYFNPDIHKNTIFDHYKKGWKPEIYFIQYICCVLKTLRQLNRILHP